MKEFFSDTLLFLSPIYFIEHCIIIFTYGLFFGSFLNVCIYRIPLNQSVAFPGSHCFSCGAHIKWYDNIPLISYLVLRGRCRNCGSSYSIRYFLIELMTALLYLGVFIKFGYSWLTLLYIVFVSMMIVATFTDIDHWIIPDSVSIGGFIGALIVAFFCRYIDKDMLIARAGPYDYSRFYNPLINAFIGGAVWFTAIWSIGVFGSIIFKKEAMGFGDVKLFAFIGAVFGVFTTVVILTLSSFIGAIIGITTIIINSARKKQSAPPQNSLDHEIIKEDLVSDKTLESQPDTFEVAAVSEEEASQNLENASKTGSEPESIDSKLKNLVSKLSDEYKGTQIHQLPYGPYICIASVIVLFFSEKINRYIQEVINMLYF